MSSLYINDKLALIDYTSKYFTNNEELLSSEEFNQFMVAFLENLKKKHRDLYKWLLTGKTNDQEAIWSLIKTAKLLCVLPLDEVRAIRNDEVDMYLNLVESAYKFWRNLHRFSLTFSNNEEGLLLSNFMSAEERYNNLIISFYRLIQEKLQGYKNNIYRQLQAGTNGGFLLCNNALKLDGIYSVLNSVPVVEKVVMKSPLIVHLKHNKRIGKYSQRSENPFTGNLDLSDFFCYPCFVGESYSLVVFHKKYTASAIGLANLFEFADFTHLNEKPKCITLFGVNDGNNETTFYYDKENDIYIGYLSDQPIIEYFGYFKKTMLTLHNLSMISKGKVPIHGAMLNIYLKDGRKKGVCLMGDSGCGKSESIEAMSKLSDEIAYQEIVFDDMGCMYTNSKGEVVATGTETGAFVRLDDLDAGSAYKDIDRSIFFNPESSNSRVITPAADYKVISKENKVDIFLYANNYTDENGLKLTTASEARDSYKQGKRFAIGTTGETGISTTYFANPFGPMQKVEECDPLIDQLFIDLEKNGVKTGQLYTHLGLQDKEEGLSKAAEELLKLVQE